MKSKKVKHFFMQIVGVCLFVIVLFEMLSKKTSTSYWLSEVNKEPVSDNSVVDTRDMLRHFVLKEVIGNGNSTQYTEFALQSERRNCWEKDLKELPPCKVNYRQCTQDQLSYKINLTETSLEAIARKLNNSTVQGQWSPCDCIPQSHIAVIIGYRDRESHLAVFLNNLIPYLQYQRRAFTIYLVDQALPEVFNRAALFNVGYLEASKRRKYDCYIFHDVDLIPQHLCNVYTCDTQPRHMSVCYDKVKDRIEKNRTWCGHYWNFFGGVSAFREEQLRTMNGFTNIMFGWGGEDDEADARIRASGYDVLRHHNATGRYFQLKHSRDSTNKAPGRGMGEARAGHLYRKYDGLSTAVYRVKSIEDKGLFIHISVQIPGPTSIAQARSYFAIERRKLKTMYERSIKENKRNVTSL